MRLDNLRALEHLFKTKKLKPELVTVVNEVAYWYDYEEADAAIKHSRDRINTGDYLTQAFNRICRRLRHLRPY